MSIDVTDVEILVTAQDEAGRILSSAREEVKRFEATAKTDAAAILLQQQDKAERLLFEQRAEAAANERETRRTAEDAAHERRDQIRTDARRRAEDLLDRQWLAAEALSSSERETAARAKDEVGRAAVETLLRAHREAAAVLLRARMVVEERAQARLTGSG